MVAFFFMNIPMKTMRVSIILLLCLMALGFKSFCITIGDNCDKVEVSIDTHKTSLGKKDGTVKVTLVKGDPQSVKFIFCESEGRVLNEEQFNKSSLEGLSKGEYLCIVVTKGCSKKVSFTIE